jgi:DNA-binding transcriptional ArsR family regulator
VFKALAHPVRRRIVAMLRNGPLSSGDIADAFDMAWPSVTGHLNALKEASLVETERDPASGSGPFGLTNGLQFTIGP